MHWRALPCHRRKKVAWIYRSKPAAIGRVDIVMANVSDFRGARDPDSDTALEIGFAAALVKRHFN
ncbi:nucleoside 2-deoxyribosyltransferase [Paraburkholderia strydomiana]|uniref:nucleoside 2-deoxyribosyltransferase n=1 Tax=Paraburkholderia strydomiana TaxID=1245417 RepID=UPI0038BA7316